VWAVALRWIVRALLTLAALVALVLLAALIYVLWVVYASHAGVARTGGTETGMPVQAPVTIARDARGVPHIRAASLHDLFVAEGYAMGSDRLFQMDLTRRYVDGRLSELLGSNLVRVDRRMRRYGIRDLAARVYAGARPDEKAMLVAFADGINAAAARQPTPPEYRALFSGFERWQPEDALAVGFATVLDLDDKPDDVIVRDDVHDVLGQTGIDALYPLTDPKYDVPTNGRPPGRIASLPALSGVHHGDYGTAPVLRQAQHDTVSASMSDVYVGASDRSVSASDGSGSASDRSVSANDRPISASDRSGSASDRPISTSDRSVSTSDLSVSASDRSVSASGLSVILSLSKGEPADERPAVGSNGWAVGAERTTVGRAILANDPHLDIAVPGIWYLVEASAPGLHVAGGALAGTPGVTLGHNEHVAWGVTAGETAAMHVVRERTRGTDELYERGRWVHARHRHEQIGVRFGGTVDADLLESDRGVVMYRDAGLAYLMDWRMRRRPVSPLAPFTSLLHARTAADGIAAMRALPEPALNVLVADDGGRVAYHLAGGVPLEPSWGRWAPDGDAPQPQYSTYESAPHVDPSRSALLVTANNRADGDGSPRLAPYWQPPYRAFEIRRALAASADAHGRLSPDAIAHEQRDATSPAEREFANLVLAAATRAHADGDASLAPLLGALRTFDGTLVPESRGATAVVALRRDMLGTLAAAHLPSWLSPSYPATAPGFEVVLRALRERPHGWVQGDDYDAFVMSSLRSVAKKFGAEVPTFGTWAAQPLKHPLAAFGFKNWNGPTMPGRGGSFAPAVQWNDHAQSFRAVWIAGDWDHGTIDVDAGESGEPGSPHYADQNAAWQRFDRTPLPFSDAAVRAAMVSTQTLTR
jgi:penicillin G amidase